MGTFLKQPQRRAVKTGSKTKQSESTSTMKVVLTGPDKDHGKPLMQHDINHVAGLSDVEESLDWIARSIGSLTADDRTVNLSLSTGFNNLPVKITLAENDGDDSLDRLLTAVERIADAVAKLAGLSRPRLESWHEQEEYEPRYKATACDGGAPGPKS